jgi:hypothetical protein
MAINVMNREGNYQYKTDLRKEYKIGGRNKRVRSEVGIDIGPRGINYHGKIIRKCRNAHCYGDSTAVMKIFIHSSISFKTLRAEITSTLDIGNRIAKERILTENRIIN